MRSAFTCAVIQALNRNRANCNHGMGLIWNSFRKEQRSSKFNCPWTCAADCHAGPNCSLPSSCFINKLPFSRLTLTASVLPRAEQSLWVSLCSPAQSYAWGSGSSQPDHAMERPLHRDTTERTAMSEGRFLLPWGLSPFADGQDFMALFCL